MASYDWWDVLCAILLLAGVGRLVILVCRPGRLPQIIRIGKFHAWLLMISGMLCVPSCYWLAWAGQIRESLRIIESFLVIGGFYSS
jgi:hypothetical protein